MVRIFTPDVFLIEPVLSIRNRRLNRSFVGVKRAVQSPGRPPQFQILFNKETVFLTPFFMVFWTKLLIILMVCNPGLVKRLNSTLSLK